MVLKCTNHAFDSFHHEHGFVARVIFSVKTGDNPGPCWSAPIPVSLHLLSLPNSVFLVCFHIPSLPAFLTLAFMPSLLRSSSLYLPLSVSLISVSPCTSAPLSSLSLPFSLSAAYRFFQLFFSFSFSICNFSLANTSVNHMTVTLLS